MDLTAQLISQIVLQGGAVVVLLWVVSLLTSGKLHTSSEVDGLRKDKDNLLEINARLSSALEQSNNLLRETLTRGHV